MGSWGGVGEVLFSLEKGSVDQNGFSQVRRDGLHQLRSILTGNRKPADSWLASVAEQRPGGVSRFCKSYIA